MTPAGYHRGFEPAAVRDYTRWFAAQELAWTMRYRRVPLNKTPADLWVYQELISALRPRTVIEFGTWKGGTTLFLADLLDVNRIDYGLVVSVDVDPEIKPPHERIIYLAGDSMDPEIFRTIVARCHRYAPVLVIEDSDHTFSHVRAELGLYCSMVTPGSYFIVEDTGMGYTDAVELPEVARAVADFLATHPEFEVDWAAERFGHTTCRGGFLRRKTALKHYL